MGREAGWEAVPSGVLYFDAERGMKVGASRRDISRGATGAVGWNGKRSVTFGAGWGRLRGEDFVFDEFGFVFDEHEIGLEFGFERVDAIGEVGGVGQEGGRVEGVFLEVGEGLLLG